MAVSEALDMSVLVLIARAPIERVGTKTTHTERCGGDRGNIARVGSTCHRTYQVDRACSVLSVSCRATQSSYDEQKFEDVIHMVM